MVSHELRTPLSLIVGLSDMVLQEQHDHTPFSDTALRDLKQIHTSARHLGRLIGDVLDLASSEAGQLRLLYERLDLTEVLKAAAQIGEQLAHEKGLTWQAHLPQPGPRVLGDRTRLRQIALNLISNAVKFTASGTVMLEVKLHAQQATVLVSDTGLGILPTEQERIFRELERSERTTLRQAQDPAQASYGGLGLGLAICKQLVEKHGGTIGVRSPGDLGDGATFFFTLPVISDASVASNPNVSRLSPPGYVVVVTGTEDGDWLGAHLRERGFEVKLCHVDQETDWLAPLLAAPTAALVLDQKTAIHYGWALVDRLKRQPPAEHLPVLVYSLDFENDRGEWLELNYLHKPLARDQLIEQLARFGGGSTRRVILVVDDDPDTLDLHCRLVEQAGCRPLRARNGREALELLEHTHPDLILLDLMMPEMDGFTLLDVLRARETTRDIPVIVLTARVLDEAAIERLNRGVAVTLSKGLFNATETLRHIETVLARQQTLGSATQRLVRRAMVYIHAHYAESPNREVIANHVGFSTDYLTDCFRQELGVTPMVYLNRYRIHQACELLENNDLTITQVAFAVGFSASAQFTRAFQREIGVTPRAYRRGERSPTPT